MSFLPLSAVENGFQSPPPHNAKGVVDSDSEGGGQAMDDATMIAIVDDDPWVRKSLARLMRSVGFRTASFASAEEFLESVDNFLGCVILDLKLPGMDGLEVQRRLLDEHRRIPVVFVSAHDDRRSKMQALQAGATAFLNKPFGDEVLLDAVESALRSGKEKRS